MCVLRVHALLENIYDRKIKKCAIKIFQIKSFFVFLDQKKKKKKKGLINFGGHYRPLI